MAEYQNIKNTLGSTHNSGLPALSDTPKQVAWVEKIRAGLLDEARDDPD